MAYASAVTRHAETRAVDRTQDVMLTLLTIALGPVLLICGATILGVPTGALLSQQAPDLIGEHLPRLDDGPRAVERAIGLGVAGLGLVLGVGSLFATAATAALVLLSSLGRLDDMPGRGTLEMLSPLFMRRALVLAVSAQLVVLGSATTVGLASSPTPAMAPSSAATELAQGSSQETTRTGADSASPAAKQTWSSTIAPGDPLLPTTADTTREDEMTPLFTPQKPTAPAERHQGGQTRNTAGAADEVTVRPGDTLWSIAADQLGPHATDWEIAEHWPRWHEANRDAIGDDPSHLLPGSLLHAPPLD